MEYHLAGHQWSAVTLALGTSVALAAEFVAAERLGVRATPSAATAELDSFLAPLRLELGSPVPPPRLASDPLSAGRQMPGPAVAVAQPAERPTVSASGRRSRRLTAILVGGEHPVAVLDDIVVSVGDRLPDGAQVDAILADRVWVVERNGQRHMLTLKSGRQ